jgi:hypothetical protein
VAGGGCRPDGLDPEQRHRCHGGRRDEPLAPDQQQRERHGYAGGEDLRPDGKGRRAFGPDVGRVPNRQYHLARLPLRGRWMWRCRRSGAWAVAPPGVLEPAVVLHDEVGEGRREAGLDREAAPGAGRLAEGRFSGLVGIAGEHA